MPRRFAALALAVVLAGGLAACTAPSSSSAPAAGAADEPGDGGQSAADACAIVQQSISDATSAFSASSLDDPQTVVDAMQSAAGELETVAGQVTNDEVAALLPALREMFGQAGEAMDALASGDVTRLSEVNDLSIAFSETTARFEALCTTP